MDLKLRDRIALVCASSKGLGFAVANALAQEGAKIAINGRDQATLDRAAAKIADTTGRRPMAIQADLTLSADRSRLVAQATDQLGPIDILVANAGGPPNGAFLEHDERNWQLAFELALGSATHLSSLLVPGMKDRGFGRIVHIVSIAAFEVIDGLILSNASRPAVLGFARALAREIAPENILVNSICPGMFKTDRLAQLAEARARGRGVSTDRIFDEMANDIPLGRLGDPQELGDLAAFLCSPRNTYITGAAIPIEGGRMRRLY